MTPYLGRLNYMVYMVCETASFQISLVSLGLEDGGGIIFTFSRQGICRTCKFIRWFKNTIPEEFAKAVGVGKWNGTSFLVGRSRDLCCGAGCSQVFIVRHSSARVLNILFRFNFVFFPRLAIPARASSSRCPFLHDNVSWSGASLSLPSQTGTLACSDVPPSTICSLFPIPRVLSFVWYS